MVEKTKLLLSQLAQNLAFAPITNQQNYENHIMKCLEGLLYAKYFLQQPSNKYLKQKFINLPQKIDSTKKTLFLDLDETLVSTTTNISDPQGTVINFQIDDANSYQISVRMRPYLKLMLETLSKFYEIYIFSAGKEIYVNRIVSLIDPNNEYINGILSQKHCLQTKADLFIKDLRIINNRKLSEMIIVDNFVYSYAYQIENGIPIISWHGDAEDKQLIGLTNYLIYLASFKNLINANKPLQNFEFI